MTNYRRYMSSQYVIFISIFLLYSCVSVPNGYNDKIHHPSSYFNNKRYPRYNQKYINLAKQNLMQGEYNIIDYDEEDLFDDNSIAQSNRNMYLEMIELDKKKQSFQQNNHKKNLNEQKIRFKSQDYNNESKLYNDKVIKNNVVKNSNTYRSNSQEKVNKNKECKNASFNKPSNNNKSKLYNDKAIKNNLVKNGATCRSNLLEKVNKNNKYTNTSFNKDNIFNKKNFKKVNNQDNNKKLKFGR